ncbi:MAG: dicarboxylate/amino acid:cation symporter [Muribaculaceae bacterium]
MKKIGLFPKVLCAIIVGSLLGMVAPEFLVRIFKTFNGIFAQLLKFIVPLLVLGLVTPSICRLGKGAGKILITVMGLSYMSTICAGFFAYGSASYLLPHYLSVGEISSAAAAAQEVTPYISLKIPPVCDILTALCLSFMLGVGGIFTNTPALRKGFDEFGEIVKLTIERVIIPLLPWYIFTMMCEMSFKGQLSIVMGSGVKIIATGVILSVIYLIIQYCIAATIAGKNPLRCLWNIVPAYLTGFSICSSSAVIPVTLKCALKMGVKKEIADFTIPLCGTVHMCGSTIKLITTSVAVMYMAGMDINFALIANFVLLQGIAAVAAPGVMGGVLMASVGLLETVLGFSPEQSALMMTIYLALDGYGPACNVSGDAAITLVVNRFFGGKNVSAPPCGTDKQFDE